MTLPADIKQIFFDTLQGDKNLLEFEQWLYADKQLENVLSPDDYLELISFSYKRDNAKYDLYNILEKYFGKDEYEKMRILNLLGKALNRDKELPQILMTFYDLYCKGYNFFDNLGLGYGLAIEAPYPQADNWDELNLAQQYNLLSSFYPGIEIEIKKVVSWLENGTIILTGAKDEYNHFVYIDNRTEIEKRPTSFTMAELDGNNKKP